MFNNRPALNHHTDETLTEDLASISMKGTPTGLNADVYHIRDSVQRKLLAETEGEMEISHIPQMR
ncbi:MAG: hypothetical protein JSV37_01050, partial [Anaerolineaceae bacterium]